MRVIQIFNDLYFNKNNKILYRSIPIRNKVPLIVFTITLLIALSNDIQQKQPGLFEENQTDLFDFDSKIEIDEILIWITPYMKS